MKLRFHRIKLYTEHNIRYVPVDFSYALPEEDLKIAQKLGMKGKVFNGIISIKKQTLTSVTICIYELGEDDNDTFVHLYKDTKLPKLPGMSRKERILKLFSIKIQNHFQFIELNRKRQTILEKRRKEKRKADKLAEKQSPFVTFSKKMHHHYFRDAIKCATRLKDMLDASELSDAYSSKLIHSERDIYYLSITCLKTEKEEIEELISYERQIIKEENYQAYIEARKNRIPDYLYDHHMSYGR